MYEMFLQRHVIHTVLPSTHSPVRQASNCVKGLLMVKKRDTVISFQKLFKPSKVSLEIVHQCDGSGFIICTSS